MKHLKTFKNLALGIAAVLLAAGCAKQNNDPSDPTSTLAVYHVSPDAPKLIFKLNSSLLNTDSVGYGTYGYYVNAYSGSREISAYQREIKKTNTTITLKEGSIYSIWLTGAWATSEFVILEDKLSNPPAGKANVRFVNMSPGSPALDLVTSTGTSVISNTAYKSGSDFGAVDGNQNYNFVIRQNGSTVDKVLLPSVTIQAGRIYTIVAKGFYTGTGATALSGDVLINY
ncbi:DUF4397 domain-containing protein [Mucilaginibacter calamicampi]|uniref:DUF4397 domain-containing protein n=1 Tax=Mucilaginibacter calamicampi TaxID=1302352 RepID=A0ABW2YTL4_9SPHI